MAALAALPPLRERLPARAVVGLALGFIGVAMLVAPGTAGGGPLHARAVLLLSSLSWSCGSLYARRATAAIDPLVATGWEMLIGGVLFLLIASGAGSFAATRPDGASIAALVYLITAGSWVGFTAYVWLLAHAPAAKVATYAYVNPVIAVLLGWWILDERITSTVAVGSAIIVVAVVLVTTARVRNDPEPVAVAAPPRHALGGTEA
jgi:drug/metabolite transporter (DMT)-like permease